MLSKKDLKRQNFEPDDFFNSETAKSSGIKNYPSSFQEQTILAALMSTADLMQEIRNVLNKPIKISSAYRCPYLNKAVGSKDNSQHLQGLACDFTCKDFGTPEEIIKYLHSKKILVDQCFNEGSWVHVSRTMQRASNRMMYGNYLLQKGTRKFVAL